MKHANDAHERGKIEILEKATYAERISNGTFVSTYAISYIIQAC